MESNKEDLKNGSSHLEEGEKDDGMEETVAAFQYYVEGVGILAVGSVGVVINIVALYILFRKQVMRNFHLLMCSLALYDLVSLILDIGCFAVGKFSVYYRDNILMFAIPYVIPLTQISLTGSCYTTIAITIERFLAIRLPFFIQKHNVKARVFILPIVIYCLVYNSPRFFEYEILYLGCVDFKNGSYSTLEYDQANNITCEFVYTLDYSEMRKTQLYISLYVNSMTLVFNTIVPLLTLTILNYLTYKAIKQSMKCLSSQPQTISNTPVGSTNHEVQPQQQPSQYVRRIVSFYRKPGFNRARNHSLPNSEGILRGNEGLRIHHGGESLVRKREARITKASIGITIMFLVCNTPRVIPNLVEVLLDQNAFPKWLPILVSFNHLLITVNCSFNFLFYLSYCRGNRGSKNGHFSSRHQSITLREAKISRCMSWEPTMHHGVTMVRTKVTTTQETFTRISTSIQTSEDVTL